MKTRDAKYEDYGISKERAKAVLEFCRNTTNEYERKMIYESVKYACPDIREQLYESLVSGKSYEKIQCKNYIPIGKKDFYGYRRKAMWKLDGFLRMHASNGPTKQKVI